MKPDQFMPVGEASQFVKILQKLATFHVETSKAEPSQIHQPARAPDKRQGIQKRIFLVEDHSLMRRSMVEAIEREPDLTVCGQAEDAPTALAAILSSPPDLVLTDIRLKASSGLDLIKSLRDRLPLLPIVATTMFDVRHIERLACAAGATDFAAKGDGPDKLISTIRKHIK